jgi:hypothetical protein
VGCSNERVEFQRVWSKGLIKAMKRVVEIDGVVKGVCYTGREVHRSADS